jgi:hypothetical protein
MIDRRGFMKSSLALGAIAATWPASSLGTSHVATPAIVLVDRRLGGSAAFAAAQRSLGLPTVEFAGDAAGLWMRELEPRLRTRAVSIAGYTSAATLFCLDLLARDYGARTVERAGDDAVSWIIASTAGRRAPLAPAEVRALARE